MPLKRKAPWLQERQRKRTWKKHRTDENVEEFLDFIPGGKSLGDHLDHWADQTRYRSPTPKRKGNPKVPYRRPLKKARTMPKGLHYTRGRGVARGRYRRSYRRKRVMSRRRRYPRRRYKSRRRNLANMFIETKRYILPLTNLVIGNNGDYNYQLFGPTRNANPLNNAEYQSQVIGNQYYSMGHMLWLDLNNTTAHDYHVFIKVIRLYPRADQNATAFWHDPRTNDRATIQALPFSEKYGARCDRDQARAVVYAKSFRLHANQVANEGPEHKHLKIWIPVKRRCRFVDGSWTVRHQLRIHAVRSDGNTDTAIGAIGGTHEQVEYYKDG